MKRKIILFPLGFALIFGSAIAGGGFSENEISKLQDLDVMVRKLGEPDYRHPSAAGQVLYYRTVPIDELPESAVEETKQGRKVMAGILLHFGDNKKPQSWNRDSVIIGAGKKGQGLRFV